MRVLHLNTHASGGSYEYAALLSTALTERGIESRVLSKNSEPLQARRPFLDRVIRRSYVSLSTEPWHGTRRLLSPPAPQELDEIDVVHLHTLADWFDVPRWLETVPRRIRVVISVHDMWHITGGCFLYRGCNRFNDTCTFCPILKPPLNRVLAKDEHRRKLQAYQSRQVQFVASSQWLANVAERSPLVKAAGGMRLIRPGIDTDVFTPRDKAECRASLGIQQDAFVIAAGAASLTDANKNIRWLLERLARLPKRENLTVLLAGEGALQIPVGLNVHSLGGVPDREKRAVVFSAADVFASASLLETYGLTLIEAMSCGTPVVAFRTGGVPEAVVDREGGILCEILDAAGFKSAIETLRSREELRRKLGSTASKLVATRNAKELFAAAFARVYRECFHGTETVSADASALAT